MKITYEPLPRKIKEVQKEFLVIKRERQRNKRIEKYRIREPD